jgi:hypothetical protein
MPSLDWDERAIPAHAARPDAVAVEGTSVAHELPEIYRAVLDRIASLERIGHRREAELIRREAVAAYSRAWDEAGRRRLERLRLRAERVVDGHERPRVEHPARLALRWSRSA